MYLLGVLDRDTMFIVSEIDTKNSLVTGKYLKFDQSKNAYFPENIETVPLDIFKSGFDYLTNSINLKKYDVSSVILNPYMQEIIQAQRVTLH